MLQKAIEKFVKKFLNQIKDKKVYVVGHFDTDGITSTAIFSKTLTRLNQQFSIKIIKQLDKKEIELLPKDQIILFLDLGSGSLEELKSENQIFIIDHHEISSKAIPENIEIINPHLLDEYEELCAAELAYLTSKTIAENNKNLAYLSIIGMIGDTMEKKINKTRNQIIRDANVQIKKGLLIYPSTRPIDKTLEFSSRPFIPGITGNPQGIYELLKEIELEKIGKIHKALIDLNEKEMKRLVTAVLLRTNSKEKTSDYIGNLYLIKLFNKIEDAREISAMINACSRMGYSHVALMFCMGNASAKKQSKRIYVKYRQHIIAGLKHIDKNTKIEGREYVIINAKDNIKDTIIGTLASILSFSSVYKEGTIIIAMAYNEDKIKISSRIAGRNPDSNRNLKKLMDSVTKVIGGNSGGHKMAAGCTIEKEHENKFIEIVQKKLEFELVKV